MPLDDDEPTPSLALWWVLVILALASFLTIVWLAFHAPGLLSDKP